MIANVRRALLYEISLHVMGKKVDLIYGGGDSGSKQMQTRRCWRLWLYGSGGVRSQAVGFVLVRLAVT
jgi:hypothetical protein